MKISRLKVVKIIKLKKIFYVLKKYYICNNNKFNKNKI